MANQAFLLCSVLLLLVHFPISSLAAGGCSGAKFTKNRSYVSCMSLSQLNATLHWTYDAASSSLSVAFTAPPAAPNGWVAWAINPTAPLMLGAQALVAFKQSNGALGVQTYNISGYTPLSSDGKNIAFNATDLKAESGADGMVRIFAKLQLPVGMTVVNQVWQVGSSVTGGVPDKHAMGAANLAATGKLNLLEGGGTAPAPAPSAGGPGGPAPTSGGGSKASAAGVVKVDVWRMVAGVLVGGVLMILV